MKPKAAKHLRYCVDEPAGADVARGREVRLRGWVFAAGAGVKLTRVRACWQGRAWDGEWEPRKDVAAAFGMERLTSGFTITLLPERPGPSELLLQCADVAGTWHDVTRIAFEVHERLLVGGFDDLPARGWVGEPMHIAGWCFFPGMELQELHLLLGRQRIVCSMNIVRGDVALRFPEEPASVFCGFEAAIVPAQPWTGRPVVEGRLPDGTRVRLFGQRQVQVRPRRLVRPMIARAMDRWQRPRNAKGKRPPVPPAVRAPTAAAHPAAFPAPEKPLKVMCVTNELTLTGGPLYMLEVIAELKRRGIIEPLVVSPLEGPLRAQLESLQIPVRIRPPAVEPGHSREEALAGAWQFGREMAAEAVHVIYANTIESFAAVMAAADADIPSLWNIHESEPWRDFFKWFPAALPQKQIARLFAMPYRVIFAHASTRSLYDELMTRDNFCLVPGALDLRRIPMTPPAPAESPRAEARFTLGIAAHEVMLLAVGTVCERKGQQTLARALEKLPPELWPNLRCFIVGDRPGAYSAGLHQIISQCPEPLRRRITVIPETPNAAPYYAAADLFICASRIESYPRVIMEAMAHGLPIVTTDVFGIRDQVRPGINGLFFPAGDAAALQQILHQLLLNAPRRNQMAGHSLEVLAQLPTFETMAQAYARFLREAYAHSTAVPHSNTI